MYKIIYNKNKTGNNTNINAMVIDSKDLDMMRYSSDMTLMRLYGFYLKEHCKSLIIMNNNNQNRKEIRSILKSKWLFNEATLTEELTNLRIDTINEYLGRLNEKLLDPSTEGLDIIFIKFEIYLYNYAKETLDNYLKESHIKKRVKE